MFDLGISHAYRHRTLAITKILLRPILLTIGEATGNVIPPRHPLPTRSGAWTLTDAERATVNEDWEELT